MQVGYCTESRDGPCSWGVDSLWELEAGEHAAMVEKQAGRRGVVTSVRGSGVCCTREHFGGRGSYLKFQKKRAWKAHLARAGGSKHLFGGEGVRLGQSGLKACV